MKIRYLNYMKGTLFGLMFLTLPFALVEQFLFQEASRNPDKVLFGVTGLILGLIETFLVLALLGYYVKKSENPSHPHDVAKHFSKYLRDIVIESFRAMGRIAIGLLLIVPGIKRAIQYYLVPYIVQFDSDYQAGKKDVLNEASLLLEGHFLKFSLLLGLTQIVMFMLQIASVNFNLFTAPLAWILFYLTEVFLQATVFWVFYIYYKNLVIKRGV